MEVDTIVSLDNNCSYLLLDSTEIEDRKFFFAVKVTEDLSEPTKDYAFIESFQKNGEEFAKIVNDKEIIKYLATVFTNNYVEAVEDKAF